MKLLGNFVYASLETCGSGVTILKNCTSKTFRQQGYWVEDAKPFFDYWDDLSVFLPFLELAYEDYPGMSRVLGPNAILKKMIIWKLCSHPETNAFIKNREEKLSQLMKEHQDTKKVEEHLQHFLKIKKRIEETDPICSWSEDFLKPKLYKGEVPLVLRNAESAS